MHIDAMDVQTVFDDRPLGFHSGLPRGLRVNKKYKTKPQRSNFLLSYFVFDIQKRRHRPMYFITLFYYPTRQFIIIFFTIFTITACIFSNSLIYSF